MPKFFCNTQDKEVEIQTNYLNARSLEDSSAQIIPGTKVCIENKNGRCFEFDNCPLRHK